MKEVITNTEITLLRHGECEGGKIFRGSTDVPLSSLGWQQMHDSCKTLECDLVLSSPLRRCREFADMIAERQQVSLCVDKRWREMSFGDWEGKEIAQVWQDDEARILAWSQNPEVNSPPEGEPLVEVKQRVEDALDSMLSGFRGKKILLVSHGGTIRVMLAHILQMPLSHVNRFDIPYAGQAKIIVYHTDSGDVTKLIALNNSTQ